MMLNAATFESLKQWICALRDPLTFQKKMEMLDCEMQEHKDLQSYLRQLVTHHISRDRTSIPHGSEKCSHLEGHSSALQV